MTVTLFSLNDCGQCIATEKWFSRKGIRYQKVMIDDDEKTQEEFRAAGYRSMPVVRLEKAGQKVLEFAGFSDQRISELHSLIKAS